MSGRRSQESNTDLTNVYRVRFGKEALVGVMYQSIVQESIHGSKKLLIGLTGAPAVINHIQKSFCTFKEKKQVFAFRVMLDGLLVNCDQTCRT